MMKKICLWPVAIVATLILTACTLKPETQRSVPVISASPAPIEVVHTARYTLVSLTQDDTLAFPLRQIVNHEVPAPKKNQKTLTRGETLKIWLLGTGYSLCQPITDDMRLLYNSVLPDSQRAMGPLRTETALQVIAGPAWTMSVDEITRTVCFARAPFTQTLS